MPDTVVTRGADWKVRFEWSDRRYVDAYFDGDQLVLRAGLFVPATGALGLRTAKPHLVKHISPAVLKAVRWAVEPTVEQ